jgi:hypothetical protein
MLTNHFYYKWLAKRYKAVPTAPYNYKNIVIILYHDILQGTYYECLKTGNVLLLKFLVENKLVAINCLYLINDHNQLDILIYLFPYVANFFYHWV